MDRAPRRWLACCFLAVLGVTGLPSATGAQVESPLGAVPPTETVAGSTPLLEALAYVPPDLDLTVEVPAGSPATSSGALETPAGLEFIDWAALNARDGSGVPADEASLAPGDPVERAWDPADMAWDPADMGWDRAKLAWELRIGPDRTVLHFLDAAATGASLARAEAVAGEYGLTVTDGGRTVVIERGGTGEEIAALAAGRDPLEVAAGPYGRVATRLGRPLVARLHRGEDVCSGTGEENALLRGEAARLAASVGRLHPFEVLGAGYQGPGPGGDTPGRYVFDYARPRHARADLAGRRALIDTSLKIADAEVLARDVVIDVAAEPGEDPAGGDGARAILDQLARGPGGEPALLGICGPPPSDAPLRRQASADVPVFVGPATLALSGGAGIHRWDEARFGADEVRLRASLGAGRDPCALWLVATDPTVPDAPLASPTFTVAPESRTTETLTLPVDYAMARLTVESTCQAWALRIEPLEDPALAMTLTERFYPVRGTTIAEIAAQTNQSQDGWAAYATWETDWRFTWQDEGTSCTVTSGEATLTSRIEYPSWHPPADADVSAVAEWRRFIDDLTTHELGHITIALQGADAIDELLDRGMSAPTCAEVERAANEAARRLHDRYDRLNARYDRQTDHGAAQGSTLR